VGNVETCIKSEKNVGKCGKGGNLEKCEKCEKHVKKCGKRVGKCGKM